MNTLISPENTWALLSIMCGAVFLAIYLEQNYKWASKLSGAIICLILALVLSNFKVIPTSSTLYDDLVWGFVVPMAIPLLLLQCNIKKIWKVAGRLLILFLLGSVGTSLGAILGYKIFGNYIPELGKISAIMTGSYIGGTVNFTALIDYFRVDPTMISATIVADNLLMTLYFFILIVIPSIGFFKNKFKHPYQDENDLLEEGKEGKTKSAIFWERKPISLRDISINIFLSVAIVTISGLVAEILAGAIPKGNILLNTLNALFGNKYLVMTTITMIIANFFSEQVEKINGSQELGTYLIFLFFFVIGVPASILDIFKNIPLLLVFCGFVILINMLFCFIGGKILNYNLEEIILASNANIGGPTTAAAMAVSKGWTELVGPIMLIGTVGYAIGTYFGIIVGNIIL